MEIVADILRLLDSEMTRPGLYGWFHILWLVIVAGATVFLCKKFPKGTERQVKTIIGSITIAVIVLEIYKQINYTFQVTDAGLIEADFQWYAFPFQFCSMPMYVGLLAAFGGKGRFHKAMCAFLASYAVFAGVCVMLYPGDVFVGTIGINIQTMICHGTMIVIGVYLMYTGYVPCSRKTFYNAVPVFAAGVIMAAVMNEIAYAAGLLETETFNMFFISPHCDPSLPVYSLVQAVVPYPLCLIIYIAAFSAAAGIILLLGAGLKRLSGKRVSA